ncbi:MAG: RNA polymerase sigma factor [Actinomycetota bacterium]
MTTNRDREFHDFFAAESERLQRFATLLVGDAAEGADLAQEALVRAYKHWERIKHDSPGPYVRKIVVNLLRSAHRAKKLRALKPVPAWASEARPSQGPGDRVADWMRVSGALEQLSPMRRATVLLRFYEDMGEQQIARVLDRPLGTVKSDLHRALRQLRPLLEEANVGERGS